MDEYSTCFAGTVMKDSPGAALELMGRMIARPALRPDDLQVEKQIVEQENCRGCYSCNQRDALLSRAFPDHPIGDPVIGYEDTVTSLTVADLTDFHRRYYVTSNLIVSVAGDVDHDTVIGLVASAFADLPLGERSHHAPLSFKGGDVTVQAGSDHTYANFALPLPYCDGGRAAVLWSDIGNSLLMRELREKRGLV